MAFNGIPVVADPYAQTIYGINGKAVNPCRRALRDLMREMLIAIPEILLVRDSPLLQAYNNSVDALAADDLWEKQMQDYLNMQPNTKTFNPGQITWTAPSTTTSGGTS